VTDVKTLATGLIKLEVDASDVQGSMTQAQAAIREMTRQSDYEVRRLDNAWRIYEATTKNTAASSDRLAERKKYLNEKLAIVNQQVTALQATYDKFGGKQGDVTAQTHKVALALDEAKIKQAEMNAELRRADAEKIIKVREEVEKTSRAYDAAAVKAAKWGAAIVGAYTAAIKVAVDYGSEINRVSMITGASAETVSSLAYAAEQNETSLQALSDGLKYLARNMNEAHAGGKAQQEMFKALGVDVTDAGGRLRSVEEVLLEVSSRFAANTNETEKSAMSMQLFGRSGDQLIPMLNLGAAGIREFQDEARRLNATINDETAQALDDLGDSVGNIKTALKGMALTLAGDVLPGVKAAADNAAELAAKYKEIPEPLRQFASNAGLAASASLLLEAGILKVAAAITKMKLITAAGSLTTTGWVGLIALAAGAIYGLSQAETQRREGLGEMGRLEEDLTIAIRDEADAQERLNAVTAAADGPNKEDIANSIEAKTATDNLTDALNRRFLAEAALKGLADPAYNSAEERRLKMHVASPDITGKYPASNGWGGSGDGSGKVITELDVLDYRLKRAESQSRLYGDSAAYVAERQALMEQQLAIANEAVAKAEQAYTQAASTTGLYSEAAMQAGQALDQWREKQDALTKSIEATRKAMDPVTKAVETVERGGGSNKALKGLLRAGLSNYDEQAAVLSQASGFDLSTARAMLDSTLMDRFKQSGNIPAASRNVAVTVNNNGRDLSGDDVVKAIGRAEVIR
jgi:hypothetical protein